MSLTSIIDNVITDTSDYPLFLYMSIDNDFFSANSHETVHVCVCVRVCMSACVCLRVYAYEFASSFSMFRDKIAFLTAPFFEEIEAGSMTVKLYY